MGSWRDQAIVATKDLWFVVVGKLITLVCVAVKYAWLWNSWMGSKLHWIAVCRRVVFRWVGIWMIFWNVDGIFKSKGKEFLIWNLFGGRFWLQILWGGAVTVDIYNLNAWEYGICMDVCLTNITLCILNKNILTLVTKFVWLNSRYTAIVSSMLLKATSKVTVIND